MPPPYRSLDSKAILPRFRTVVQINGQSLPNSTCDRIEHVGFRAVISAACSAWMGAKQKRLAESRKSAFARHAGLQTFARRNGTSRFRPKAEARFRVLDDGS
jgi:hypothetical protein